MRSTTDSARRAAPSPSSLISESLDCSISRIASFTSGFSTTGTFLSLASAVESLSTPSSVLGETKAVSRLTQVKSGLECYVLLTHLYYVCYKLTKKKL